MVLVLSHFQANEILAARDKGLPFVTSSIDLGISTVQVLIEPDYAVFPDSSRLSWNDLNEIVSNKNACYSIANDTINPIRGFSEVLGRACSLMPTPKAPVLIVAGFPMHRFKDITPVKAAAAMVEPLFPLTGNILDTSTGLGYTAILAAKKAGHVTTIELCPAVQEIARLNPWSRELFDNPRIERLTGDSSIVVTTFADEQFSAVIHDPPAVNLAGDLYSGAMYRQLFRIIKPRGKLFHYIGDPESASGSRTTKGVVKRLGEAGFRKVVAVPKAFGVAAWK